MGSTVSGCIRISPFLLLAAMVLGFGTMAAPVLAANKSAQSAQKVPEGEELWQVIQNQQKQIEALADALEKADRADDTAGFKSTHLGGYGELHYQDLDTGKEMDFHRFVIFLSHEFSDRISLHSELELEHSIAGDGQAGEIELEQAYVQWDYADSQRLKSGLFLLPLGHLNETHEPDVFYAVERNAVEKNIVPTTWWEGGVALQGELSPGWSYDFALHSGLNLDTGNLNPQKRSSLRGARQKVGKANGDSLATTARVRFSGIAGLQWALAFQYQEDITQDDDDNIGIGRIDATLLETDLSYQSGRFTFKALYAIWDIDKEIASLNPGADSQLGWYLEPSYRINDRWGIFARYSNYDLTQGSNLYSNNQKQMDFGVNYWLHENVVFKFDYQKQSKDSGIEDDGFHLGIGFSF